MTDDVARAICKAAGRSLDGQESQPLRECPHCDEGPTGPVCRLWETFRHEAQQAIIAAHAWNKRERRWPSYAGK